MKASIIVNQRSKGAKKVNFKYTSQVLSADYETVEIFMIRDFEQVESIKEVVESSNLLVTVCGDGTISFVVNAMMKYHPTAKLMILPTGTMNDFAYGVGMHKGHLSDLLWYKDAREKSVDLIRVNDWYATYLIGLGGFMEAFTRPDANAKQKIGKLAYLFAGIKAITNLNKFNYKLNGKQGRARIIVISNISSVGGFRKLFPIANVDDGVLNVLIIRKVNILNVWKLIFMLFGNRLHQAKEVEMHSVVELMLESDELDDMDIDGDRHPFETLEVKVIPRAISVIVPKK